MTSQIAPRASGPRPVARKAAGCVAARPAPAGCKTLEEPGAHVAGFTDRRSARSATPSWCRSSRPRSICACHAARTGLNASQRRRVAGFLDRFRNAGMRQQQAGDQRAEPARPTRRGDAHDRPRSTSMVVDFGFSDSVDGHRALQRPATPQKRRSASPTCSYIAEGPDVRALADQPRRQKRNLNYANFGCAQQRNLAAQIANPADLIGPRTMTPSDPERRAVVIGRYENGENDRCDAGRRADHRHAQPGRITEVGT